MNGLMQDLRYAVRQLRKSPAFFSVVVLTLGLGIGANTAIFSMVDWLVLRSLPIKDPQQMHFLVFTRPGANSDIQFSYPEFAEIQKQTTDVFSGITPFIFGGLAGEQNSQSGLTADGTTKPVQTAYVGGDFFSLLGIAPASGRFILSTEGKAAGADPVVVLSYDYWQTRFSGDPAIVGKAVSINGHPVTIIGVAPNGFLGPTPLLNIQAYLPLSMFLIERGVAGDFLANPSTRSMLALARVKPGANSKRIQSETRRRGPAPAEAISQRSRNWRIAGPSLAAARNYGRGDESLSQAGSPVPDSCSPGAGSGLCERCKSFSGSSGSAAARDGGARCAGRRNWPVSSPTVHRESGCGSS